MAGMLAAVSPERKMMPPITKLNDQPILVPTKEFPHANWKYPTFNPPQSRVFEYYDKDNNGLIASATSSGKTTVAEMVLSHEMRVRGGKGLYLVPMRALAQEKIDEWTDPNHHFKDKKISICTGDYRLTKERAKELAEADLIIMTSEMLNHRARNYKSEQNNWLLEVGSCVVDEGHLLTVPGRGDHLEVGLMKFTDINPKVRLFLLSATMPNVEEIAAWVSYSLNKRETFCLRSQFRPCALNVHYEMYDDSYHKYDDIEQEKVLKALDIVEYYTDDKFLIFSHTKRTGELMKTHLRSAGIKAEFHNANLDKQARVELEIRFRKDPEPRVIVATPTLAWGCYAAGTTVLMSNGLKRVEDIIVGDMVLAKSDKGFVSSKVLRVGPTQPRHSFEFITASGEVVVVSPNHQFYAATHRNAPAYESAEYCGVGDYLAVPGPMNVFGAGESDDAGYFLGYSMGDGSKTDVGEFANGDDKIVLDISFGADEAFHIPVVQRIAQELSGFELSGPHVDSNGVLHLTSKRREIVNLATGMLSGRNKDKLTLHGLKRTDAPFVRGIIQGLFDTDGGFSSHGNGHVSIEFTSISKQLVSDVQQYLLLFGVRSAVGRKRMKDTVINGRLQKAKRDWIHRVRIYSEQVPAFLKNVGFRNEMKKRYGEYLLAECEFPREKNIIPARTLLRLHAEANDISPNEMMKSVNCNLWNSLNTQDLKKETCDRILELHPRHSPLTDLIQGNIRFVKIKSKRVLPPVQMHDIEVEGLHNYVGGGIVSHNCNLPARRVIVLGVHRGLDEVETYNVTQMVGRSGRVGLDPQGDAYVLLPESKVEMHKTRLNAPQRIESQLLAKMGEKHKVLAFHLVSEIHHGDIKTTDDVHRWYKRSLAYFQNKSLEETVVDGTLALLKKCGAIQVENDTWTARPIGKVSSMFYISPFDVSDLYFNFKGLFEQNRENDDYLLSMALGNTDSQRTNIVSRLEKDEMSMYVSKIRSMPGGSYFNDAALKAGYCYFNLLNGVTPQVLAAVQRNFQFDFNRLSQVLQSLDSLGGNWQKAGFFKTLEGRITSGVPVHLVDLCRIPNIGKAKAVKLFGHGIKTVEELADAEPGEVKKVLNMKQPAFDKMMKEVQKIVLLS